MDLTALFETSFSEPQWLVWIAARFMYWDERQNEEYRGDTGPFTIKINPIKILSVRSMESAKVFSDSILAGTHITYRDYAFTGMVAVDRTLETTSPVVGVVDTGGGRCHRRGGYDRDYRGGGDRRWQRRAGEKGAVQLVNLLDLRVADGADSYADCALKRLGVGVVSRSRSFGFGNEQPIRY
ncbi:unnamed protein product, partial [Dibothriocephalus latus]